MYEEDMSIEIAHKWEIFLELAEMKSSPPKALQGFLESLNLLFLLATYLACSVLFW